MGEYLLEKTQRCHQTNWVTGSWAVHIIPNHCFSTLLHTAGAKHVCLHKGGSGRVSSITLQCCCCSLLTIKAICFEISRLSVQAGRMRGKGDCHCLPNHTSLSGHVRWHPEHSGSLNWGANRCLSFLKLKDIWNRIWILQGTSIAESLSELEYWKIKNNEQLMLQDKWIL